MHLQHVAIPSFALGKRDFFFWLKAHFKNQFVRGKRARRLKGKVIFFRVLHLFWYFFVDIDGSCLGGNAGSSFEA